MYHQLSSTSFSDIGLALSIPVHAYLPTSEDAEDTEANELIEFIDLDLPNPA